MTVVERERIGTDANRDLREVAWWVLVGAAAGALSGLVIGGVGGRLAMLLLRLTSPDYVIGVTSDDGFEIGAVTTGTFNLFGAMAMLGAFNGVLYATMRSAIPRRLRLPLWSLLAAFGMGANVIHTDGVDFTLLEPTWLAIALFLVVPLLAGALVVVLVERWADREPFTDRRSSVLLCLAALLGSVALVLGAVVAAAALIVRRLGLSAVIGRVARIAVPIGLIAAIAYFAVAAVDVSLELL